MLKFTFFLLQIQEIVTTGKLSKLEHFETDEKVNILNFYKKLYQFEISPLFITSELSDFFVNLFSFIITFLLFLISF